MALYATSAEIASFERSLNPILQAQVIPPNSNDHNEVTYYNVCMGVQGCAKMASATCKLMSLIPPESTETPTFKEATEEIVNGANQSFQALYEIAKDHSARFLEHVQQEVPGIVGTSAFIDCLENLRITEIKPDTVAKQITAIEKLNAEIQLNPSIDEETKKRLREKADRTKKLWHKVELGVAIVGGIATVVGLAFMCPFAPLLLSPTVAVIVHQLRM